MSENNVLHAVSVYFKGDSLAPDDLTNLFGVEPTRSHLKGEKKTFRDGGEAVRSTGLWVLKEEAESPVDLSILVGRIVALLFKNDVDVRSLPNVEEAYVDIFIAPAAEEDGGGTCEFDLSSLDLANLNKIGLPVQFTVAVVRR